MLKDLIELRDLQRSTLEKANNAKLFILVDVMKQQLNMLNTVIAAAELQQ